MKLFSAFRSGVSAQKALSTKATPKGMTKAKSKKPATRNSHQYALKNRIVPVATKSCICRFHQ